MITSPRNIGRLFGALLLLQGLLSPIMYFRLLRPATGTDFLATAAASALGVRIGVLLLLCIGALTIVGALMLLPLLRQTSERLALFYLALAMLGLALLAVEGLAVRNMLALSQEAAEGGAATELLRTLGTLARSQWRAAHFTGLLIAHVSLVVLYVLLGRSALVPRAFAAFGAAAALLSTGAVAMPLLGYPFTFTLIMPTALGHLALTLWLIGRGFEASHTRSAAHVSGYGSPIAGSGAAL